MHLPLPCPHCKKPIPSIDLLRADEDTLVECSDCGFRKSLGPEFEDMQATVRARIALRESEGVDEIAIFKEVAPMMLNWITGWVPEIVWPN